jgi:hypothetical protein
LSSQLQNKKNIILNPFDSNENPYLKAAKHILFSSAICKPFKIKSATEWVLGFEKSTGRRFVGSRVELSCNTKISVLEEFRSEDNSFVSAFATWIDEDGMFIGRVQSMVCLIGDSKVIQGVRQLAEFSDDIFKDAQQIVDDQTKAMASIAIDRIMSKPKAN